MICMGGFWFKGRKGTSQSLYSQSPYVPDVASSLGIAPDLMLQDLKTICLMRVCVTSSLNVISWLFCDVNASCRTTTHVGQLVIWNLNCAAKSSLDVTIISTTKFGKDFWNCFSLFSVYQFLHEYYLFGRAFGIGRAVWHRLYQGFPTRGASQHVRGCEMIIQIK